MSIQQINFSGQQVSYLINEQFEYIKKFHTSNKIVILTDYTVYELHTSKFDGYLVLKIDGAEKNKNQTTIDYIIAQMLENDRSEERRVGKEC